MQMNITESRLEALKFYLSFGAPVLVGEPDFSEWCDFIDGFTTWVGETRFSKTQYRKLEMGAEVFNYLQEHLDDVEWKMVCTN